MFSERLRVVGGFGLRHQGGESETFLGGSQTSRVRWLFGNAEYRPTARLTLNAGGYGEENTLSASTFSPRVAANLQIAPGHGVRFVYSTGTRSPDIHEQRSNWTYRLEDVTPPLNGSTSAFFYWLAAQTARDGWLERLPTDRSAWFGWMLELPQADLLELFAFCASATVNALPSTGTASEANALAQAVDLDMADWWKPTAEAFLNHVSKAQIVQALKEAGPDLACDGVESMKKDVLVNTALSRLAGTRWLPAPLRPPPA